MLNVFLPFIISFLISIILIPPTIKFAYLLKLLDDPNRKHPGIIHKKVVPRAGGLPIFIAIVLSSLLFLPKNDIFVPICLAGLLVVLVGLLDDRYDLSPYVRFIANIIAAFIVVSRGVTMPFITNPFGGILFFNAINFRIGEFAFFLPLSQILAIFWIVWTMNMLNWSKGVDGQMPGIVIISSMIIGIASLRFPVLDNMNIYTSQMSFIIAGASLGFLIFNFYPAKIFPGYSATILGFMLGILSLLSSVKLATAILVMGIPTIDAVITITRRVLSKKSPFWHDREHLHHLLLNTGFSQRKIALFYWTMSLFLGIVSLMLSSKGKLFAIILVAVLVTGFILGLKYFLKENRVNND